MCRHVVCFIYAQSICLSSNHCFIHISKIYICIYIFFPAKSFSMRRGVGIKIILCYCFRNFLMRHENKLKNGKFTKFCQPNITFALVFFPQIQLIFTVSSFSYTWCLSHDERKKEGDVIWMNAGCIYFKLLISRRQHFPSVLKNYKALYAF